VLYELRMYECMPGRLPDVLKNFETIILKQFEKHGIKQAGFWTTVIGESSQTMYYMLVWESLAEREQKWGAFVSDPAYEAGRAKIMANGPTIANAKNFILSPTPFSAVK
jgi:hypothetical protein